MAAYALDLRARIFNARQDGDSTADVAERFDVSPAFVRRLMQRHRATGSLAPKTGPRGPKPQLVPHYDRIRQLNVESPDLTAAEVRDRLQLTASVVTVWRAIVALGLTVKKKPTSPANATART